MIIKGGGKIRPNMFSAAAANGNLELIQLLIAQGFTPFPTNGEVTSGEVSAQINPSRDNLFVAGQDGAGYNTKIVDPLSSACLSGNAEVFNFLLAIAKGSPKRQQILDTALYILVSGRPSSGTVVAKRDAQLELTERLIQAGANVNSYTRGFNEGGDTTIKNMTPLHMAIFSSNLDALKIILNYRPNFSLTGTGAEWNLDPQK